MTHSAKARLDKELQSLEHTFDEKVDKIKDKLDFDEKVDKIKDRLDHNETIRVLREKLHKLEHHLDEITQKPGSSSSSSASASAAAGGEKVAEAACLVRAATSRATYLIRFCLFVWFCWFWFLVGLGNQLKTLNHKQFEDRHLRVEFIPDPVNLRKHCKNRRSPPRKWNFPLTFCIVFSLFRGGVLFSKHNCSSVAGSTSLILQQFSR